jgi:HD-GYP domain-containing protein (c-di-GMP phosphodiesterase class II)
MQSSSESPHRLSILRERLDTLLPAQETSCKTDPMIVRLQELTSRLSGMRLDPADDEGRDVASCLQGKIVPAAPSLPPRLAWRTRRLVLQGRDHIERLKQLGSEILAGDSDRNEAAAEYAEVLNMAELALRSVQTFPEDTAGQLALCPGLEGIHDVIRTRVDRLERLAQRQRSDRDRTDRLAQFHRDLLRGQPISWPVLGEIADELAAEADAGRPLHLLPCDPERPGHWAAAHCLNIAGVSLRILERENMWRVRRYEISTAALLLDAGLALIPAETLALQGPLGVDQRRQLETHAALGAEAIRRARPQDGALADVVASHHERLDGTGYPAGWRGKQIPHLARLLAVCDTYVALRSRRPYREALSPRAALAKTLLEAEKGHLDAGLAEMLLNLTFCPVGTVVELSDASLALVVATNGGRHDPDLAVRPIVQIVREGEKCRLGEIINLGHVRERHVVRCLPEQEIDFPIPLGVR